MKQHQGHSHPQLRNIKVGKATKYTHLFIYSFLMAILYVSTVVILASCLQNPDLALRTVRAAMLIINKEKTILNLKLIH